MDSRKSPTTPPSSFLWEPFLLVEVPLFMDTVPVKIAPHPDSGGNPDSRVLRGGGGLMSEVPQYLARYRGTSLIRNRGTRSYETGNLTSPPSLSYLLRNARKTLASFLNSQPHRSRCPRCLPSSPSPSTLRRPLTLNHSSSLPPQTFLPLARSRGVLSAHQRQSTLMP